MRNFVRSFAFHILLPVTALTALSAMTLSALAQDSEHSWQKQYTLSGAAALTIETGDSAIAIHTCGGCSTIRIAVDSTRKLSDFRLEEHQEGGHVFFLFKEKPLPVHFSMHSNERTHITVETPAKLELEARSVDGGVTAEGIEGTIQIRAIDGSVDLTHVQGALHLQTSDGGIHVRESSGTIQARTSDGHLDVDGKFSALELRSSDGEVRLALRPGTRLESPSQIQSSDGKVAVVLPKDLSADLDVSTSDGHVDCVLPVSVEHFDSHGSGHHSLRGKLNAGGVPLTIHTSDGSVHIAAI
jgi:hypothetical protein